MPTNKLERIRPEYGYVIGKAKGIVPVHLLVWESISILFAFPLKGLGRDIGKECFDILKTDEHTCQRDTLVTIQLVLEFFKFEFELFIILSKSVFS